MKVSLTAGTLGYPLHHVPHSSRIGINRPLRLTGDEKLVFLQEEFISTFIFVRLLLSHHRTLLLSKYFVRSFLVSFLLTPRRISHASRSLSPKQGAECKRDSSQKADSVQSFS